MRSILLFLVLTFSGIAFSFAQEKDLTKIADSITNEGKVLYKSEWASWYGTDVFVDKCKTRRLQSGGYISYDTGKGLNNIFFSKGPDPIVLATISFGYDFNSANYKLDTIDRKLSSHEKELYTIRQAAVAEINKDTLFKHYINSNLNPIPVIRNNSKKVYVIDGPNVNGVVIFGNDYLVNFDQDNNIVGKKILHKNRITIHTDKDTIGVSTFHTHLPETGDFIAVTDVCTLLLYEKFTKWTTHFVRSKDYVSIWNCKRNELIIMTAEAVRKITESEKKN